MYLLTGCLFSFWITIGKQLTCSRHQNLQNIWIRIVQLSKKNCFEFFFLICITYFKALNCTPMQSELEKVAWFQCFALLLIKKKTKFCKQKKIGWFEYFGDSDVVNKLNDPAFTRSRFWTRFFSNDQVHHMIRVQIDWAYFFWHFSWDS